MGGQSVHWDWLSGAGDLALNGADSLSHFSLLSSCALLSKAMPVKIEKIRPAHVGCQALHEWVEIVAVHIGD